MACAALAVAVAIARPAPASANTGSRTTGSANTGMASPVRHVVVVGLSGLRWSQVTTGTAVWRLAERGSAGGLIGDTARPVPCPADGWLTLNAGARAAVPPNGRGQGTTCPALPAVVKDRIPALPGLIAYNARFHENPDWGGLGRLGGCSTAVGPGAALALAQPDGSIPGYVPSRAGVTANLLARCPLTIIDLNQIYYPEQTIPTVPDQALSRVMAELPPDTLLLLTAPGGGGGPRPHLLTTVVSGPGYDRGLLRSASTRRPGIVTLTDLVPSIARWLGRAVPGYLPGAVVTRGERGSLTAAVRGLTARDTAEQVWMSTRMRFFAGYAALDILLLGGPALVFLGAGQRNRRRRAACWKVARGWGRAGTIAAAVPVGTFLAGLAPWSGQSHPSVWLYGMSAGWTAVGAGLALAVARRRGSWAAAGAICLVTLGVLGIDAMTGSRLQLETPFGLSLLSSGRYYGIGNNGIGVYCVAALVAAAWAGSWVPGRPWFPKTRGLAVSLAGAVGVFAVVASGWPGFGAKVGGTIALVPGLALLLLALAGVNLRWRYAAPVALSGLTLVAVFAAVSYLVPAAGVSDIGAFFGNLLHGQGGAVLERKAGANLGTLTASPLAPLVPLGLILAGLLLWRLSPKVPVSLLRVTAWLVWLVLVLGWLADDSGVIVPATAAPFALPLVIGMCASAGDAGAGRSYCGSAFDGSSVAGQPVTLRCVWNRQALCSTSFPVLRPVPSCTRSRSDGSR